MGTMVKPFRWRELYATGIEDIDQQHERITGLLNELQDAFKSGAGRPELGPRWEALTQAISEHFGHEERLMKKYSYPAAESHRREHHGLTERLAAFHQRFQAGDEELTESVLVFLKDWLRDHLLIADKRMGDYLRPRRRST